MNWRLHQPQPINCQPKPATPTVNQDGSQSYNATEAFKRVSHQENFEEFRRAVTEQVNEKSPKR